MANIKTNELDQLHHFGVYTPARLITLFGEINEESAGQFLRNIRLLDHLSSKEIKILINTDGGDVHQGLAIIDAIKECQSRVVTHAVGPTLSMGAAILQSGDFRLISANAIVMIHKGQMAIDDHTINSKRWIDEYERIGEIYEDILLEKIKTKIPSFTKKRLEKLTTFDTILSAEEVVEHGLADEIVEHKETGG